jgi:hypothetical protein
MRTRASLLLVACLLTSGGVARADVTAADRATARTLAQEGQEALEAKKYGPAAERFARADQLVHAPTLLLGLARAQVGLGKLVEALESYNRIVREGVAPTAPKSWSKAYEAATAEVETVTPRIPWVTITVLGPTSPEVVIDTSPVPAASLGVKRPVNPGIHKVRVSAEGYIPAEKTLNLAEGQTLQVPFELEQVAAPTVAHVPVGSSTVLLNTSGTRSGSAQTTVGIVALSVGGAGLIAGGVTGVLAMLKHNKLDGLCPDKQCPGDRPGTVGTYDNYHTLGHVSEAAFIAGGVGVALGAVLLLTRPRGDSISAGQVSPYIGVGNAGVFGTF